MLNSITSISLFLLFMIVSCNKGADLSYDREVELKTDTTIYIYKQQKTLLSPTELQLDLELGQFTDLISAQNYPISAFSDPLIHFNNDLNVSFLGQNRMEHTSINEYTTLLVLDESAAGWYDYNKIGFSLRRYFELVNDDLNKKTGLFIFREDETGLTGYPILDEMGDVFKTKWENKVEAYYQMNRDNSEYYGRTSRANFFIIMNEALDYIISSPETVGQKSITSFIASNELFLETNPLLETELMNLISKANTNNVQLNFITDFSNNLPYFIAERTNGFVHDNYETATNNETSNFWATSEKSVIIQNLNDLLSNSIATLQTTVKIEPKEGVFNSGEVYYWGIRFMGYEFRLPVVIP